MEIATLQTRLLGTTDLAITPVGFGAWAIGGGDWAFGWGPQDDRDSLAAMRHALELGINWIDTAAVYGLGHSEQVVGRLLRHPARLRLVDGGGRLLLGLQRRGRARGRHDHAKPSACSG